MESNLEKKEILKEEAPKKRGRKPKTTVETTDSLVINNTDVLETSKTISEEIKEEMPVVANESEVEKVVETKELAIDANQSIKKERIKLSKPLAVYKFKSLSSEKHTISGEATFTTYPDSNWISVSGISSVGYIKGFVLKNK